MSRSNYIIALLAGIAAATSLRASTGEVDPVTLANIRAASAMLSAGYRPEFVVRAKGAYLGLDLGLVKEPSGATRALHDAANKYPAAPLPRLSVDKSTGDGGDGLSIFYSSVAPVSGSNATLVNGTYYHAVVPKKSSFVYGCDARYTSVDLSRTIPLVSGPSKESVRMTVLTAEGVVARQGKTKGGGSGLIPHLAVGGRLTQTAIDVPTSQLSIARHDMAPFAEFGLDLCIVNFQLCAGAAITEDHAVGHTNTLLFSVRR